MPRAKGRHPKVIGDLSIYPIGEGTSLGDYVRAAFRAMQGVRGIRLAPSAMSTVMEADDLGTLLVAVKRAHAALLRMGARRIALQLRVDHRLDKAATIESKVGRIKGKI